MKVKLRFGALLVAAALSVTVFAQGLGPGSPAPALAVKTWYKGQPVETFDKSKTYVVEFWATWCGPCRTSIPHVTKLAKENPDVTFLGISIWEDDKDDNIKKFVAEMGDKMDYNVGYSANKEGMAQTWMAAAGQNGIPAAFVVKGNTIQWIGHPMEMDEPLKAITTGKWDLKSFKDKYEAEAAAEKKRNAVMGDFRKATQAYDQAKTPEEKKAAAAAVKKLVEQTPDLRNNYRPFELKVLADTDPKGFDAKIAQLSKDAEGEDTLTTYANTGGPSVQVPQRKKAMEAAIKASGGKDLVVYYNASNFYTRMGDSKKALEYANKTLELYPTSQFKDNADVKKTLEALKTKAEEAVKKSS